MTVYLIRHGETDYNTQKRYQGQRDIPLSAKGRAALHQADFTPALVYVSPLQRARQTAGILFPGVEQLPVEDLKEMNFGSYEGKVYVKMENDPDYLAWVASNCESPCPDGEKKETFAARSCAVFARLLDQAFAEGKDQLVILAHGGTQMSVMERYALPHKAYHEWCGPNAGGFVLETDADTWKNQQQLCYIATVQYTKPEGTC